MFFHSDKGRPGIPDFWLTIFKNVQLLNDMIQPHDEPILRHLTDIKLLIREEPMVILFFFLCILHVHSCINISMASCSNF